MTLKTALAASIEVIPTQVISNPGIGELFPKNTGVYLPDVGSDELSVRVAAAKRLNDAGYCAVPHIPARRVIDAADVELRVRRFVEEAGVTELLIIGGGLEHQAGQISSTMDVIETGVLDKYQIATIAVAGHPEGSPDFPEEVAYQALKFKQAFAERTNADMRIVTQFGFDPQPFIKWAEQLHEHGVHLPVHIGVTGPAKITTLVKFAAMCGVGPSLEFLKKRAKSITTLIAGFDPEVVVGPIEKHVQAVEKSAIHQLHVFPFGGATKASEWLHARGSWTRSSPEE